jgi:hypothetical protein
MTVSINGAPVQIPNLEVSLQIPTNQDPRCLATLQVQVEGQLVLAGLANEESDVTVFYSDGTQVCSGKGIARTHTLRTVGGRDMETLVIELSDVQGL